MQATPATCKIDGCDSLVRARGWCSKHYRRWLTHGDPSIVLDVYGKQRPEAPFPCSAAGCDREAKKRGLCQKHYMRLWKYGTTDDPYSRRFWAQVDKAGPGGCWLWTGYVQPAGYGNFGIQRERLAHRIAYNLVVGPIPAGRHLDHLCRVRRCVNPDHLEPVTPRENLRRGDQGRHWGFVPDVPERTKVEPPTICAAGGCGRSPYKRDLCRPHYRRWLKDPERTSDRLAFLAMSREERFWSLVDRSGEHWLWLGGFSRTSGYGSFGKEPAHRFAYRTCIGPIPERYDIHHICGVRLCVRPEHLEAVTRSVNLARRIDRTTIAAG